MPRKLTKARFIERAREAHGDKFDYSKVEYTNARGEISIICPHHGEFTQKAYLHLGGNGCHKCAKTGKRDAESFINKSREVHGNRYDYSKVEYVNNRSKVAIICPVHGEFLQTPKGHQSGRGCRRCSGAVPPEDLKTRALEVHGDRYDYSATNFRIAHQEKPVAIICRIHGPFSMGLKNHIISAQGCPSCGLQSRTKKRQHTAETFIKKARAVHGDKFDYSKTEVEGNNRTKAAIICNQCGDEFRQRINDHLNGSGCPSCAKVGPSAAEQELADFVYSLGVPMVQNDRTILKGRELDIVCPLHGVAIEYNGLYWHSDLAGKPKNYHLEKTRACNACGLRLIHIFEGDDMEQAKKLIAHALGANRAESVYARKCRVFPIDGKLAKEVLTEHHPQGYTTAAHHLGTYYGEELVAVTSIGNPFRSKLYKFELKRHVTVRPVIGGLGKVVKYFKREHMKPGEKLGSLCDLSRFDGKSYEAAGFTLDAILPPDYQYAVKGERVHKSKYQKSGIARLLPEYYDAAKTEREMMEAAGIDRVYDCGKARYIFRA